MKTASRLPTLLRVTALFILVAGVGTWIAKGAHLGWTQTSVVTLQRDDITGIEYPVRRPGFVAGIEVPLAATAIALAFAGLGALTARRVRARA